MSLDLVIRVPREALIPLPPPRASTNLRLSTLALIGAANIVLGEIPERGGYLSRKARADLRDSLAAFTIDVAKAGQ